MTVRGAGATISTLLVDDEALALGELTHLLKDFPDIDVIGTAMDGLKAAEAIDSLEPDLVFMDVQMPGLDGLGVIRRVRDSGAHMPHFVLATAFEQYAVESYGLEALDYLLKPIEKARLAQTIDRARRSIEERAQPLAETADTRTGPARNRILIRQGPRNLIVDAADIVFATIDQGVITVVTSDAEGLANYRTIEEMHSDLDPEQFWRVHRSYLVNINHIREVVPWFKSSFQIKMTDRRQTVIPVSRVQTKKLRLLLKL